MEKKSNNPFDEVEPFDKETGDLNVIIDTPKGSRNKYKFDEKLGIFKLSGVLTLGHSFPFDFGFIPNTVGGDGDALDVLVLMDEPAFVGCLVVSRLIGVIEAEQTERNGRKERNDRLIAVAAESKIHENIKSTNDFDGLLLKQIEHFFISYNEVKGKKFKPLGRFAAVKAKNIVESCLKK